MCQGDGGADICQPPRPPDTRTPAEVEEIERSINQNPDLFWDLSILADYDRSKSIRENVENFLNVDTINPITEESYILYNNDLQRAFADNADDFSLLYLLLSKTWDTVAFFDNNPTIFLSNVFGIPIEVRDYVNPVLGGELRTQEGGGCNTPGCGEYGAARNAGHEHAGTDFLNEAGGTIIAPNTGTVRVGTTSANPDTALPLIEIRNENGSVSVTMYVNPNSNIQTGSTVNQGDIIGTGANTIPA